MYKRKTVDCYAIEGFYEEISGNIEISGDAEISGNAWVSGKLH